MQDFWDNSAAARNIAFVTQNGESMTYAELYAEADDFAARLPARSFVFIYAGNNKSTLIAYLGCLRHNHVCLLLSHDLLSAMRADLTEIYKPDYIYEPVENGSYKLEKQNVSESSALHPDLSLLLSTSGSTGSPKLVRLKKSNLQANAAAIAKYLQLDHTEKAITNLPFFYSYGLSIINSHLYVGATLLLTDDSIITPSFWQFADTQGFTSLAGVPYTYDMLEAVGFRKRKCPTLRYMTQAGGHMNADKVSKYAEWAENNKLRFYVMYGQTEATARMSYLPPHKALSHPDSIGIAIPGGAFQIDAPDGETGELLYKGDNVCMGYAEHREELSLPDVNKGLLRTGDMARKDENGLYYITGRLKRFLKIAGNRFGLDELDSFFSARGIEAVCGGSDGKLLVAITNPEFKKEVSTLLKETWHLMRNQYKVLEVPQIPRSSTGKILYSELFK